MPMGTPVESARPIGTHIVAESGAVAWGDGSEIDVCPLSLYLDVTGQT